MNKTHSQTPQVTCGSSFWIENNTECTAICNVTFFSNGFSCGVQLGVSISTMSSVNVSWPASCGNSGNCEIFVDLTDLGGYVYGSPPTVSNYNLTSSSFVNPSSITTPPNNFSTPNCWRGNPHLDYLKWTTSGVMISN